MLDSDNAAVQTKDVQCSQCKQKVWVDHTKPLWAISEKSCSSGVVGLTNSLLLMKSVRRGLRFRRAASVCMAAHAPLVQVCRNFVPPWWAAEHECSSFASVLGGQRPAQFSIFIAYALVWYVIYTVSLSHCFSTHLT